MGIRYFVFAVNKMDLIGYDEKRFREIENQIAELYVGAAELYRQDEIALQIRMASMVNESVKEGGGNNLIVVPSSFSEGFNAGTMKDVQDLFKKHA